MGNMKHDFGVILGDAATCLGSTMRFDDLAAAVESVNAMKGRTLEEITCCELVETDGEISLLLQLLILSKKEQRRDGGVQWR